MNSCMSNHSLVHLYMNFNSTIRNISIVKYLGIMLFIANYNDGDSQKNCNVFRLMSIYWPVYGSAMDSLSCPLTYALMVSCS